MNRVIIFLMLLFNPKGTIKFFLTIAIIIVIIIGLIFGYGILWDAGIRIKDLVVIFISIIISAIVIFYLCKILPKRKEKQKLERKQQQKQQSNKK